ARRPAQDLDRPGRDAQELGRTRGHHGLELGGLLGARRLVVDLGHEARPTLDLVDAALAALRDLAPEVHLGRAARLVLDAAHAPCPSRSSRGATAVNGRRAAAGAGAGAGTTGRGSGARRLASTSDLSSSVRD